MRNGHPVVVSCVRLESRGRHNGPSQCPCSRPSSAWTRCWAGFFAALRRFTLGEYLSLCVARCWALAPLDPIRANPHLDRSGTMQGAG
jgi:hypothetical protein